MNVPTEIIAAMREDASLRFTMFVAALLIASFVAVVWISSWQEAKAFNRLTGGHATTWDAVWVQLRVTEAGR